MRKLIFNLHLYVALAAAIFVIIMGITGSIMAFEPELDHLLHPKLAYVTPAPHVLSLAEIGAAVTKKFPGEHIEAYFLSTSPKLSYRVFLEKSGTAYINQYTGEILGVQPPEIHFLDYIHQLHLRLMWQSDSDPGKKIMSWAGVAMLFLLLSGLYLWWPLKRFKLSSGWKGRRPWFDLHNSVGIVSLIFLLALTITGIAIGFERTTTPLFYKMTRSQPSPMPRNFPPPPPGAQPISLDQAIEIAGRAIPGATPFAIGVPEPKQPYQIRLRFPEDLTPGGRSRVLLDQYTGKVLFAEGSRTAPAGARLVILNRAIHTGDIFGMPSKIIMSLASLLLVVQAISGIMMWWKRVRQVKDKNLPATKTAISS